MAVRLRLNAVWALVVVYERQKKVRKGVFREQQYGQSKNQPHRHTSNNN
jgi:hypothetical protein